MRVGFLIAQLGLDDQDQREEAARELIHGIGAPAVDQLIEALNDEGRPHMIRANAAVVLGFLKAPQALADLQRIALEEPNLSRDATFGLMQFGDEGGVRLLANFRLAKSDVTKSLTFNALKTMVEERKTSEKLTSIIINELERT